MEDDESVGDVVIETQAVNVSSKYLRTPQRGITSLSNINFAYVSAALPK